MAIFVHTGDLQLGMPAAFLGTEARSRYAQARIDAIVAIGAVAEAEGAEFVVAAGDVFDSNHLDRLVVGRALEAFEAVARPVFLLPGNHDPLDAASIYRSIELPPNLSVLDGAPVRVGDVELIGAPWASKRPLEDLAALACAGLTAPPPGVSRVLVAHAPVDAVFPANNDSWVIGLAALEEAIAVGTIQYVALGDRHSLTSVGDTGRIWYSGTPEPTRDDEEAPGNVLVVKLGESAIKVEPRRVGTWSFMKWERRLDREDDVDALAGDLADVPDKPRTVLRLQLVGSISLRTKTALDELIEAQSPLFASLELWAPAADLVVMPDEIDAAELGLSGFARAAATELASAARVGAADATGALALLYRLTRRAA